MWYTMRKLQAVPEESKTFQDIVRRKVVYYKQKGTDGVFNQEKPYK